MSNSAGLDVIMTQLASVLNTGLLTYLGASDPQPTIVVSETPKGVPTPTATQPAYPYGFLQPSPRGGEWEMNALQGQALGIKSPGNVTETHYIDFIWLLGSRDDPNMNLIEIEYRKWHRRVIVEVMKKFTLNSNVADTWVTGYKPVVKQLSDGQHLGTRYFMAVMSRPDMTFTA